MAIVNLTKTIELFPIYAEAYKNRMLIYQARGETAKAEADRKMYEDLQSKPKP